jgi:polyisoprenoid-binding protein YceI
MKFQLALAALVALTTSSAFTARAQADVYKLDPAASTVTWKATKKVMGGHNGTVAVKEGTVEVNAKNEVTAATVVADMSKIQNDDLSSSPKDQAKLVGHLSSPDFFDVAKKGNETSKFVLSKFTKKNGGWVASGKLTMIGQTHPVEFPVTFKVEKGLASAEGTVKVDRTKWGLKYGSGDFFKELTADKIINNEFEIGFKLVAKK